MGIDEQDSYQLNRQVKEDGVEGTIAVKLLKKFLLLFVRGILLMS